MSTLQTLTTALSALSYALLIRPFMSDWGAEGDEIVRPLPGDGLIAEPQIQATRAITLHAPTEDVWPWLAQMGRAQTGWYGMDFLDSGSVPSMTYLRTDLEPPAPGMAADNGWTVAEVEVGRAIVFLMDRVETRAGIASTSAAYVLEPAFRGGVEYARLLIRRRVWAIDFTTRLYHMLLEPVDFIRTYAQLNGLKARVEGKTL
jgi:hypothetical protein